jgi:hypothetical protein
MHYEIKEVNQSARFTMVSATEEIGGWSIVSDIGDYARV